MGSARPYQGMDCDDMQKRLDKAEQELLRELTSIKEELQFRHTQAAKKLQQRVTRTLDLFVSGSSQQN